MSEKTFKHKNGTIIYKPYPPKTRFLLEASRKDCGSYPMLHIGFYHPTLTPIELFSEIKSHLRKVERIYTKKLLKKAEEYEKKGKRGSILNLFKSIESSNIKIQDIDFHEEPTGKYCYRDHFTLWLNLVDKRYYNSWLKWCKLILDMITKDLKLTGSHIGRIKGIQFRIWVEFHD